MHRIRYIKRSDLDVAKWDACIDTAENGLIYACSYYLDALCDNWDALVLGDYRAVMPLPWRRKWGITYVYPPPFIQQLGVFGFAPTAPLTQPFLQQAQQHIRFGEYFLNYENAPQRQQNTNLVIDLKHTYQTICSHYKTDLRNNLKKAYKNDLCYESTTDFATAVKTYQQLYSTKIGNIKEKEFNRFKQLCSLLQQKDMLCIRRVITSNNTLVSIALCLKDKSRLYFIASSTTEAGRKLKANHYLVDRLLKEFATSGYLFDFEGSDLDGVQHFYQNFGAVNQPYYFYRWNKLPWPVRLLKPS